MLDHYEVILTALHERRNRLVQLDMANRVHTGSVENLRSRINECTDAIKALNQAKRLVGA